MSQLENRVLRRIDKLRDVCWVGDSILRQLSIELACLRNDSSLSGLKFHSEPFLFELRDFNNRFWTKELAAERGRRRTRANSIAQQLRQNVPQSLRSCFNAQSPTVVSLGAWYSIWNIREHLNRVIDADALESLFDAAAIALFEESV